MRKRRRKELIGGGERGVEKTSWDREEEGGSGEKGERGGGCMRRGVEKNK